MLLLSMVATWLTAIRLIEARDRKIGRALAGNVAKQRRKENAHALASFKKAA
jgi:hypothetical protein